MHVIGILARGANKHLLANPKDTLNVSVARKGAVAAEQVGGEHQAIAIVDSQNTRSRHRGRTMSGLD